MGTDVAPTNETLPSPTSYKVHRAMCTELASLVGRVANIFPEIESARPRCSSGIQALCLLNTAIEKAKLLLQHCSDSSKLYLAITGNVILLRCEKVKNSLEQSLNQMQNMVPVMLAVEISRVSEDLRAATFFLDSSEEEVGKVLLDLIQQGASALDSLDSREIRALQLAASTFNLTSPKAILLERRALKKLLDKVNEKDHSKRKILKYFLHLLKKHGHLITVDQTGTAHAANEASFSVPDQVEHREHHEEIEAQADTLNSPVPHEEFKCPISSRVMYDPVIIESGQTFERMWIQKWFDDGHDTCPKTNMKLAHLSMIPNTTIKGLISKWSRKYGVTVPDPCSHLEPAHSLDTSSFSIASFGSCMNDLHLPADVSNMSLGSIDTSYSSDTSNSRFVNGSSSWISTRASDLQQNQASADMNDTDLSRLLEYDWENQCRMVEVAEYQLKQDNQACYHLSSSNFVEPLTRFLRHAADFRDIGAQRVGCRLLLAYVRKNRRGIQYLQEEAFDLLAKFLNSEVTKEILEIIELLSSHPNCRQQIISSGALSTILRILDSDNREFQEHAIMTLLHLSSTDSIYTHIVPSDCIRKLTPILKDTTLAGHCLIIMKNLCNNYDARAAVAETSGCLTSIAELLEIGSREDQEHAVAILLMLCSHRMQYCQLIMNEGVIPSLSMISINGNETGKIGALELLRILKDVEYVEEEEESCTATTAAALDNDTSRDARSLTKEKKSSSSNSSRRLFSLFSRSQHSRNKKEEMKVRI